MPEGENAEQVNGGTFFGPAAVPQPCRSEWRSSAPRAAASAARFAGLTFEPRPAPTATLGNANATTATTSSRAGFNAPTSLMLGHL